MERGEGGGPVPRGMGPAAMLGFQAGGGGAAADHPYQPRPQQAAYGAYAASSTRVKQGHDEDVATAAGAYREMSNGVDKGEGQQPQPQPLAVACPWTRMKWTDDMVRLLVSVVYSVGDEGEGAPPVVGAGGRAQVKGAAHVQQQQQQKKGKWKSVSRAMMEKGFCVSPQQCEDKFNDLNKRYKRVVDLLGRGTACRVVENRELLDTMDNLSAKAKDEARKLLSSKHLFFREMCAYHNATAAASHMPPTAAAGEASGCSHHPAPVAGAPVSARQLLPSPARKEASNAGDAAADDDDDDESDDAMSNDDEEEDEIYYDDDEEEADKNREGQHHGHKRRAWEAPDDEEDVAVTKRARVAESSVQQLKTELAAAAAGARDPQQVRHWVRRRRAELEEQRVGYECRAYQLEQQRLKWVRFSTSKEREMERTRLRNDRLRLDTRRMLLLLRQKELEFDIAEANSSSDQQPHHGSSPSTAGHPH